MIVQTLAFDFRVGEISCPTKYFPEASSINFHRSMTYGLGVLATSALYRLWKWGIVRSRLFCQKGTFCLTGDYYQPVDSTEETTDALETAGERR